VPFKIGSSVVVVCPYCRSVVARGDRKIEDLGKVAALVDTDSPLHVGLRGKYRGIAFEITGRAQLGHSAGGIWDEWYLAFPNDQWGWLAEAQGRFYVTFPEPNPPLADIPPFPELSLGQSVPVSKDAEMRVAEKGKARMLSAEGEIPYRLEPGAIFAYADLAGTGKNFATIDYSDEQPVVFVGEQATLNELGIPPSAQRQPGRQIETQAVSCPQCGGALELRAPDKTERVGCPYCGALLDCTKGNLRFLQALEHEQLVPAIPLGTLGTFPDGPLTVIGMMQRSVTFEGIDYHWEEYLLYEPRIGFRWLVRSDDHWSYVQPVPPGEVTGVGQRRFYHDRKFKIFQKAEATVRYVIGEFYWKVSVGEAVQTADYISPPEMLSREMTFADQGEEINWSHGTYMPVAEVEKAFGISGLPHPSGIAPNQPFTQKKIYHTWGWLSLVAGILAILFIASSPNREVFRQSFVIPPIDQADKTQVVFSQQFPLEPRKNIEVNIEALVNNTWLGIEGDLVNDETFEVQVFTVLLEQYSGFEEGEFWSEGGHHNYAMLSSMPRGKYTLRLEIHGEPHKAPSTVQVTIRQGVPRWLHVFWLFFLLSAVPAAVGLYHLRFEYRRWQDSAYTPFLSS
jgi:hypothetical protein